MKLANTFLCKSGHVGMQFEYGKGAIISVTHDGKQLQVSEDHPKAFQLEAQRRYHALEPFYKRK